MVRSSSVQRFALVSLCTLVLGACASHGSRHHDEEQAQAFDVRANAANNLAYAKDEAAMWLTQAKDRCAAGSEEQRTTCESKAQASYERQLDEAKDKYEQICAHEDEEAKVASARGSINMMLRD